MTAWSATQPFSTNCRDRRARLNGFRATGRRCETVMAVARKREFLKGISRFPGDFGIHRGEKPAWGVGLFQAIPWKLEQGNLIVKQGIQIP
jgi:hypothetical protein